MLNITNYTSNASEVKQSLYIIVIIYKMKHHDYISILTLAAFNTNILLTLLSILHQVCDISNKLPQTFKTILFLQDIIAIPL